MLAGELYHASDPELVADQARAAAWMARFNSSRVLSGGDRMLLMIEGLGTVGEGSMIRPPFHCDYGYNIRLGRDAYLNYGCVILDVVGVVIGDGTQIGPAVQILTADHPRDPATRASGAEFGRPVTLGRNVWVGGGAIVLPGVTIGHDAVIGAGSVVTHDVPAGATVMGNPARERAR